MSETKQAETRAGLEDLVRRFEDAAHDIHGDATEYLAKRTHDGFVEYVRGDVNSSWVFFKAGFEEAQSQIQALRAELREAKEEIKDLKRPRGMSWEDATCGEEVK